MREPSIEISVGFRVGKLEVQRLRTQGRVPSESVWECRCDCGAPVTRTTSSLRDAKVRGRNCGCPECVRAFVDPWSCRNLRFRDGGI